MFTCCKQGLLQLLLTVLFETNQSELERMSQPQGPDANFFRVLARSGAITVKQLECVENVFDLYKGKDGKISKRHALCAFRNLGIRIETHPEGEGSIKARVTLEELILLLVQLIRREQASFGEEFEDDSLHHEEAKLERLFRMMAWASGKAEDEKDDTITAEKLALCLRWQECQDLDLEVVDDFLFQLVDLQRYCASDQLELPVLKKEFINSFHNRRM